MLPQKGLNYAEQCLERLHAKDEAQAAPWKTYRAAKVSILRASECVIIVMIKFPCTSQIRCVNIIKNISLCSADLQQLSPSILVFRKDNKLALISFPTHWSKFLSCYHFANRRERGSAGLLRKVVLGWHGGCRAHHTTFSVVLPCVPMDKPFVPSGCWFFSPSVQWGPLLRFFLLLHRKSPWLYHPGDFPREMGISQGEGKQMNFPSFVLQ